jgi:4-amino-4-deoxy-L-arabinose transferase-like glycosyltransferase
MSAWGRLRPRPVAGGVLVFLAFAAVGSWTLPSYGVTFDEVENFAVGERFARFWLTLDAAELRFPDERAYDPADYYGRIDAWHAATADAMRPEEHARLAATDHPFPWNYPPLANTLSGLSCILFFQRLGWLAPAEAHHLPIVFFAALTVALIYVWTARRYGTLAALSAAVFLGAYPRFFADAHNNVKDLPETALFTAAMLAMASGIEQRRPATLWAFGVLWGLALAVKPNAVFLPLAGAAWLVVARPKVGEPRAAMTWAALASSPVVAIATMLAVWPYLWFGDTTAKLGSLMRYYQDLGTRGWPFLFNTGNSAYAVIVSPLPLLIAAAAGLGALWARRDVRLAFLGGWLALPIVRVSLPYMTTYGGIRHFLEFVPALAILGGIGVGAIAARMVGALGRAASPLAVVVFLAPALWSVARIHPYQTVYFSSVVGGLPGAVSLGVPWSFDYWGTSYRAAVRWLDEHAVANATVIVPIAPHIVRYENPRRDLRIVDRREIPSGSCGYLACLVTHGAYRDDAVTRECEARPPLHEVAVDGVPLVKIVALADPPGGCP